MTKEETMDFLLYGLYKQNEIGGMLVLGQTLINHGKGIPIEELRDIVNLLDLSGFIVKQVQQLDYRAQIKEKGLEFCYNDSFSSPGTSITELMNNNNS